MLIDVDITIKDLIITILFFILGLYLIRAGTKAIAADNPRMVFFNIHLGVIYLLFGVLYFVSLPIFTEEYKYIVNDVAKIGNLYTIVADEKLYDTNKIKIIDSEDCILKIEIDKTIFDEQTLQNTTLLLPPEKYS